MSRVVVVINQFALPRSEGGGTRHIDLFSRMLHWHPLIITGNRNHYSQRRYATNHSQFRQVRVPRQSGSVSRIAGWVVFAVQAFLITVSRRQLDLVYGSSPHLLAPVAGLLAAKLRRRPFILEVRDLWPEALVDAAKLRRGGLLHRWLCRIEKELYARSDGIVIVTTGWEDYLEACGARADHIIVVPNGTELTDFEVSAHKSDLRDSFAINGFTAIFAGAHGPKDGIDLVLDAAKEVPHIQFILVGDGPSKRSAVARAKREALANVQFREPIPKDLLPGLLRACDVGIHAVSPMAVFEKGMSPNKLFDYMASGLPVVSNAMDSLASIVDTGVVGIFGDSSSLARSINEVHCVAPRVRCQWVQNGYALIRERYSRQMAATLLQEVLNDAVHASRAR